MALDAAAAAVAACLVEHDADENADGKRRRRDDARAPVEPHDKLIAPVVASLHPQAFGRLRVLRVGIVHDRPPSAFSLTGLDSGSLLTNA